MKVTWQETGLGSVKLEIGPIGIYVRKDSSWSVALRLHSISTQKHGDAGGTKKAKLAAIEAARVLVGEWSSALDRAKADLEWGP